VRRSGITRTFLPGTLYVRIPPSLDGLTIAPGQSAGFTLEFPAASQPRGAYTPKVVRSFAAP